MFIIFRYRYWFFLAFLAFACSLLPGTTHAAETKKITIREDGNLTTQVEVPFVVSGPDLYVPVDFVRDYLGQDISAGWKKDRIYLSSRMPEFQMETKELTERLATGVDLNFLPKIIQGVLHVNLHGLEKFMGLTWTYQPSSQSLLIDRTQKANPNRQLNTPRKSQSHPAKINLVWDAIQVQSPNLATEEKIEGLTVLSPTWFSLSNAAGDVENNADAKYVADAHAKGYKVWPLVTNSFDLDMTHALLSDVASQDNFINQMLVYSSLYHFDGINIDFENVYDSDSTLLTEFVDRFAKALRQQNVVVSMDITVPSDTPYWSRCYDRKALGSILDYYILMAYDEHWATSPRSGSVASLGWVEKGIERTLAYVNKDKLLLGMPFYTREWQEYEGGGVVRSKALSMSSVEQRIQNYGLTLNWLEDKGQYYTEYYNDGYRYRIWVEDENSIKRRVSLALRYDLPGVAAWRKGFETKNIWTAIQSVLKTAEPDPSVIGTPAVTPAPSAKDSEKNKKKPEKNEKTTSAIPGKEAHTP